MPEQDDHAQALAAIIEAHFDRAQARVPQVRRRHFTSAGAVWSRHVRNIADLPHDLAALPRNALRLGLAPLSRRRGSRSAPRYRSRKTRELERIIETELLDLPGLQARLDEYAAARLERTRWELGRIAEAVPALKREEFERRLAASVESLCVPVEGAREALLFLVMGAAGKSLSDKVVFGSSLGAGAAAAQAVYVGQLGWLQKVWVSLFGVPGWVGVAGAAGGMLAGMLAAPLLAPLLELGINRVRAEKVLHGCVRRARRTLDVKSHDPVTAAGRLAVFLQTAPDVLQAARAIAVKLL
jgi:hypothetical protein